LSSAGYPPVLAFLQDRCPIFRRIPQPVILRSVATKDLDSCWQGYFRCINEILRGIADVVPIAFASVIQLLLDRTYSYLPLYCLPFKRGDMGETAFPPIPPCKIPRAKSSRLAKAYKDDLHVNMVPLMPVGIGWLTCDGEVRYTLETAAFHYFELSST
jgi:hypothetical protein